MVKLYRASDAEEMTRAGYSARYIADVKFRKGVDDSGFILVTIPAGTRTTPHAHKEMEEVFVSIRPIEIHIDETSIQLEVGDVVVVEPLESHSFTAYPSSEGRVLAIKFPNLKDDKIQPSES